MKKTNECSLDYILELLVGQKIVAPERASMVSSLVSENDRIYLHPLESIASRHWIHLSQPDQILTLEFLTEWLSQQASVTRYHFDPLKMDIASCTSIMSYAYASRFGIIAVKVTPSEVVIAVSDPFNTEWLDELRRIVFQSITLVVANPKEIKKYLLEFYSLSKAMDNAGANQHQGLSNIQNLEQLIELGTVDADDQHIVSID